MRRALSLSIFFLCFHSAHQLCLAANAVTLADLFADRQVVRTDSGHVDGENINASVEPGEPKHGGKPGGHSVWLSWVAPADGIITIDTTGSNFDTLLGVYVLQAGQNSPLGRLQEVGRNDDNGLAKTSLVQFGVTAGITYEIAVDGYNGGVGNISLNWDLLRSSEPPPIILNIPSDRSLQVGETLTLTIAYQAGGSVRFSWFFNGIELLNQESATLTIPNFQAQNVGLYTLRITANNIRFFTQPIEIQINSEGLTATLARDKLLDAAGSGVKGEDRGGGGTAIAAATPRRVRVQLAGAPIGVARGYNGTQIFNTTFATSDPGEPIHCNTAGGASYWFAYQAPTNGTLSLDTTGSTFQTILAVYTYDPPFLGYQQLRSIACDVDSGPDKVTSRLQFDAEGNRNYLIVVDGVNGARGITHLNYALTSAPPALPSILIQPVDVTVPLGGVVTLSVTVQGTGSWHYVWRSDAAALTNNDSPTLTFVAAQLNVAGNYWVEISNSAGTVVSSVAHLTISSPPHLISAPAAVVAQVGSTITLSVVAEGSPPLRYRWLKDGVALLDQPETKLTLPRVTANDAGIYVAEVVNDSGSVLSPPAPVSVWSPLEIVGDTSKGVVLLRFTAAGTFRYTVEFTDTLGSVWQPWADALTPTNGLVLIADSLRPVRSRFVRVRFE